MREAAGENLSSLMDSVRMREKYVVSLSSRQKSAALAMLYPPYPVRKRKRNIK